MIKHACVWFIANQKKLSIYVMHVKDSTDNKEANEIKGSKITQLEIYVDINQLLIISPNNIRLVNKES